MTSNYLFFRLFSLFPCFLINSVAEEAIIHGDNAPINCFPYQVAVQINDPRISHLSNSCGGGIISDEFILTAAHCVTKPNGKFNRRSKRIVAGTDNLHEQSSAVIVDVAKIYVPTDYIHPRFHNSTADIAVLKLRCPLGLAHHKILWRLELPSNTKTCVGETEDIAGFGWNWIKVDNNVEVGNNTDRQLRYAKADVVDTSQCRKGYPNRKISEEKQMCAKVKQRHHSPSRGVCNGDSGSPLVHDGAIVVGILSISPEGCTERSIPAIYTRVSHYLKFIDHAMKDIKTDDIHVKTY